MTAVKRAKIADETRRRMADPAIRRLISERTKVGMERKALQLIADLGALREAWARSSAAAQRQFVCELIAGSLSGDDNG